MKEQSVSRNNDVIVAAYSFAFICLSVGAAVGGYLNLAGRPQLFDIQAIIFVLFVWCVTAVALHPFLKLFKATGTAVQTMVVVLFTSAGLHIVWIPIFAMVSNVVTETRVVLTYDYAVSYSIASRGRWGDSAEPTLRTAEEIARYLVPNYSESYVPENEPHKDGTVLPPIGTPKPPFIPMAQRGLDRIPLASSDLPPPDRSEQAGLGAHSTPLLAAVLAVYLVSHIIYLGIGFSEVHGRSAVYWVSLAFLVPIGILLLTVVLLVIFLLFAT
ncbi:hypothetical protein ACVC7O_22065 (plasmid) [Roseobacter sp. A03A-229]